MTQSRIDRAVARRTGESLRTVRSLGFGEPAALEPEDLDLAVDCPFCGRPCRVGRGAGAAAPLGECARPTCDVYFEYVIGEVYALGAAELRAAAVA